MSHSERSPLAGWLDLFFLQAQCNSQSLHSFRCFLQATLCPSMWSFTLLAYSLLQGKHLLTMGEDFGSFFPAQLPCLWYSSHPPSHLSGAVFQSSLLFLLDICTRKVLGLSVPSKTLEKVCRWRASYRTWEILCVFCSHGTWACFDQHLNKVLNNCLYSLKGNAKVIVLSWWNQ